MDEPHWATVLLAAYESKGGTVQWTEAVPEDHEQRQQAWPFDLRKVTDLTDDEIENAIRFAKGNDLLSQVGSGVHHELTQNGFDVAHERWLQDQQEARRQLAEQRQHRVNLAIALLTLGLMAATVMDSAVRYYVGAEKFDMASIVVFVGLLLVIGMAVALDYAGFLPSVPEWKQFT